MSDYEELTLDPSDPETQFIPQEDDDETLWEVIEITAEKNKLYKVRWKGIDPKTQKPWPQSWVAKHDCTDDLVRDWKMRQAQKKKRRVSSKRESRISKESHAYTTGRSSGSLPPPRKKRKLEVEVVNSRQHSPGSAKVNNRGRKRKSSKQVTASDDDDNSKEVKSEQEEEEEEEDVDERMVEESLSEVYHSQPPRPPQEPASDQEEEEEGTPTSPVPAQSPAYVQQDTAEESTPTVSPLSQPQHETERRIDSLPTVPASSSSKPDPPNKKRTRPSSFSSSSATTESHTTTKHPILSQVARPRPTSRPKKRMKTTTVSKQKWEELNDFQSQQVTDLGMVPGHDKGERGISKKLPELDSADMDLDCSAVEELHPPSPEMSVPDQAPRSRAESAAGSESHSLSGRVTKSIPPPNSRSKEVGSPGRSATSSTRLPSTPLRKGSDANDEDHSQRSPILLSPRAKKRLEIFDRAMMEIELRKKEEEEQQPEDDEVKSREGNEEEEEEEEEDGEMVVAEGGRQERGFVRTSEKSWKGKNKEQKKEDKTRTPTLKPPEIKKRKKVETSDESDSEDKPALRPKNSVGGSQNVEADLAVESSDIDIDTQTSTGIVEQQLDPMHLRQEEEESTQDLMAELLLHQQQQGIGVGQSGALVPEIINDTGDLPASQIDSQPISEAMLDMGVQNRGAANIEKSDRFLDEIPSNIVENSSQALLARSHSSLEDGDGLADRKAGSRALKSRSRSHSVSSQQNKNEESDPEAVIPPTASTHRESLQALSQPEVSKIKSTENPHYLGAAMHLLNTKSEEISRLENQLSAEQRRNKDILEQLSALQVHLTEPTNAAPSATKALEQELAEARAQFALQTASWEVDRAALILDIETATRGKISAEKDRDFFREQYAKASGFVSSVREENAELEKRIKIATDQTQTGVSLIKTTFELRMKLLETDVRAWHRVAEFLMEKDRRTNDDIRRRAAEEPELRARCDRQECALEGASQRLLQVEVDLKEKQKVLLEEQVFGKKWQEVTVKLNLELNEAMTKLEKIGKIGISDDGESAQPDGHEFVYRCQWRPDDLNEACEAVFLNNSELEEHLYTGGHLQPIV